MSREALFFATPAWMAVGNLQYMNGDKVAAIISTLIALICGLQLLFRLWRYGE